VPRQFCSGRFGRGEAAEEPGQLPGAGKGLAAFAPKGGDFLKLCRREPVSERLWDHSGCWVFAVAAVSAVGPSSRAEIVQQILHHASVVTREIKHLAHPRDVLTLAVQKATVGPFREVVHIPRERQPPIPLPHPGYAKRQIAPLLQITQRSNDPFPRFSKRLDRLRHVDGEPLRQVVVIDVPDV